MGDVIYQIIVIIVAAVAVVKGFRKGFTGQVAGVLGFAFGAVCAHVFGDDMGQLLQSWFPSIRHAVGSPFIYGLLSAVVVYLVVYLLFGMLAKLFRSILQSFGVGMLDSIFGSAFCLLKYMIFLSIVYNLILCINPDSRLLDYARADDGNVVECVLLLGPSVMGCLDCEDFSHLLQLKEAKKISHNLNALPGVYNVADSNVVSPEIENITERYT